jgi:predicted nuclease of predicted toxin-antitoxin system
VKLLFDENLPPRLARALAAEFPGSAHVSALDLQSSQDLAIWEFARTNGSCIVSKDSDHYHLAILRGHPPKVVWVRLGNCTTRQIEDCLRANTPAILDFLRHPAESALLVP